MAKWGNKVDLTYNNASYLLIILKIKALYIKYTN